MPSLLIGNFLGEVRVCLESKNVRFCKSLILVDSEVGGLEPIEKQPSSAASSGGSTSLRALGVLQSMSAQGNRYDNAPGEAFFSSLKPEFFSALQLLRFQGHTLCKN
jgi:hypothetical protein